VEGPNDTASLQEVLQRRFSRMAKADEDFPDLVLVDGGKGQLSAARTALESLGLSDLSLVSLAKREEILFSRLYPTGLRLERSSPALRLLQGIRDEAHRFAISFHRKRRTKAALGSALDNIPGIGKKRKKLLFQQFKSIKDIRAASLEELSALPGISRRLAEEIRRSFSD
jgi:excinuclease ABC subunit C